MAFLSYVMAIMSAHSMGESGAFRCDPLFLKFHMVKVVLHTSVFFHPKVLSKFHLGRTMYCLFFPPIPLNQSMCCTPLMLEGHYCFIWIAVLIFTRPQLFESFGGSRKGQPVSAQLVPSRILKLLRPLHLCAFN